VEAIAGKGGVSAALKAIARSDFGGDRNFPSRLGTAPVMIGIPRLSKILATFHRQHPGLKDL
jgi:DNA-binding transcriptional LysR family regulator